MKQQIQHLPARIFLLLALALPAASCSGLGGEPAIVATLPPPPPVIPTEAAAFPQQPPNLAVGAEIYAARCSRCHGYDGGGLGELVLTGQLPGPVMSFNDLEATRGKTPQDWFWAVTNGNLEKLMPPWRDTLTEQQRWDVALYAYTLAYQPGQAARGQAVYEQACASCHGPAGRGDGPQAEGPVPDLTDLSRMAVLSDRAIYTAITQGVGQAMPAFADELSEAQRQDAVVYVRALALASRDVIDQEPRPAEVAQVPPPAATEEPAAAAAPTQVAAAAEARGVVSGAITSGTAGAELPEGLSVTLHIVDAAFNEETREAELDANGRFVFDDVPIRADRRYFTTVRFAEGFFVSDLLPGNPAEPSLDLPITVYSVTADPSVIRIASMLAQVVPSAEGLQVIQIVTYRNDSDRIFLSDDTMGEFRQASVRLSLPPGAVVREFAGDSERYAVAADGTAVIDTRPVFPGEDHIVHVMYTVPYSGRAEIAQPLDYPLAGRVQLLLDNALTLTSSQLPPRGAQAMGGATYLTYGGDLALAAGDALRYTVSGAAAAPGAATAAAGGSNIVLAAALFAAGAGALLAAALLYWRGRTANAPAAQAAAPTSDRQGQIDALVQQIAELDDAHEAGEITRSAYRKQRAALKERLAALLQEDDSP